MASERRGANRKNMAKAVEYFFEFSTSNKKFDGVVANLSKSGLCLYTSHDIVKGQKIIIHNSISLSSKKAVVRWIKKHDNKFNLVGLEFV